MTYEETIEKIHSFNKFGSKLGLERMTKLMELLGNPQNKMKIIHVGGSNGKGSVCRFLYSILQENGYRTGLYTSPYLEKFTERIEFNGSEISPEDLTKYTKLVLSKVDQMIGEGYDSPTEFELITAIGFAYFAEQDIDFLLLEVGLGGSGDSTNVVENPIATVITSISYDHMDYLGDTLEKIAIEKGGIIKSGAPVVFHVEDQKAAEAIEKIAKEIGSQARNIFAHPVTNIRKTINGYSFDTKIGDEDYTQLSISMIGMHQVSNALCALTVIEILRSRNIINIDKERVIIGISKAKHKGRLEILKTNPYIIIDGAHNEAGARALSNAINEHFSDKRILLITGMLGDKKIDKILTRFSEITNDFVATEPDNPRKFPAQNLCRQVEAAGNHCISIPNIEEACQYALDNLSRFDVIIFAGSLYLIGRVRGILNNEEV
jgi:dihydrofolate synthase/folylpolyglutamate synthase